MAVVTPIALNAVKKAKATQVAENFRNIKAAVESYVNVEQKLPDNLTLQDLAGSYLNSDPGSNFDLTIASTWKDGVATLEIVYEGKDVDLNMLEKAYPEIDTVSSPTTGPFLRFQVQKWW
ncbi:MAG: type pilus assembly protein PilA [Thermosipho sp. (in: thermotogales)]|nr:type pilus assembly protein PilA [Thermosipho sp. (in: thermotogales)]